MLWLTVHLSPAGNNMMLSIALAQNGLAKQDDLAWSIEIPPNEPVTIRFDAISSVLSSFFLVSVPLVLHERRGLPIDLMYRLYKCMGAFAVVEVQEQDRLLFQKIWLECEQDRAVLV